MQYMKAVAGIFGIPFLLSGFVAQGVSFFFLMAHLFRLVPPPMEAVFGFILSPFWIVFWLWFVFEYCTRPEMIKP